MKCKIEKYMKINFLGLLNLLLGFAMYDLVMIRKDYVIGIVVVLGVFLTINYIILSMILTQN